MINGSFINTPLLARSISHFTGPQNASFSIQTLEDLEMIVPSLSELHPDAMRATLGIHELLMNALEHGNLGIGYDEKSRLLRQGIWHDTILHKQKQPHYRRKSITIEIQLGDDQLQLIIEDEGNGFEWAPYMDIDPARQMDLHGRGIAMARQISFDALRYELHGRRVIATTYL